jgi:hypothetical protein
MDGATRLRDTDGYCSGNWESVKQAEGDRAVCLNEYIMQIELIGCTSAGKTRLAKNILNVNNQNGFNFVTSYDFVLKWAHFDWIKNHSIRMLILNLIALFACLFTWRKNLAFYRFVMGVILRLPAKISINEKLKIVRIVARNVGIFEMFAATPI